MPAAWRLATSNLSRRRGRTALLCACVALCATLVMAIACAIASLNKGLEQRIDETVGMADIHLAGAGKAPFDAALVETVDRWPEVKVAVGRMVDSLALLNPVSQKETRVLAYGIMPDREEQVRPVEYAAGRALQADGEVTMDQRTADELGVKVGGTLTLLKLGDSAVYTVVGITRPPPLTSLLGTRETVLLTAPTLRRAVDRSAVLHEIDILLKPGEIADLVVSRHRPELDKSLLLQPTARVTGAFQNNRKSSQIGLVMASVFAFLAASFIIATGMTTGVTERTRELAILRCIGATKGQLVASQLLAGLIVGLCGAFTGIPLGLAASAVLIARFPEQLPAGFQFSPYGLLTAGLGATGAGLIGAAWSAFGAARVPPLQGLVARAKPPRPRTVWILLAVALTLLALQAFIVTTRPDNLDNFFWLYVPIAIPAMITGYFLLGVPLTVLVGKALARPLSAVLGIPPRILARTLGQTPFRHGFTAASMMVGLAMLVSIWTNGRSILEHWLDNLTFPDAFVTGFSIKGDTAAKVRRLEGVQNACAITLHTVNTDAFGVRGLTRYKTTFIAFEPEHFFDMMKLTWVQGDEATARKRLEQGGAVLVAREFFVTRGIGVGSTITLGSDEPGGGEKHTFEVVGVVTSPGLEVASSFFQVGENYLEQAVSSVFGSRADLVSKFHVDTINMVQIRFTDAGAADSEPVMRAVMRLPAAGILGQGTAVWLKQRIRTMLGGSMKVFSLLAIGAMLVASFGVANIIIAGVQARTFQFGVLRAIGAQRGLLGRLVIAEALVIAVAACLLGTGLGLQAAWGGQNVTASAIGLELDIRPPLLPTVASWGVVVAITLLAAAPTAWRLVRREPRELLGVMRG